jgi:CO/xanthine dehydrogenase Mo-binding subunit
LMSCRSAATIRLKTGVMRDGRLVAAHAQCFYNKGAYAETGSRVTRTGGQSALSAYRTPNSLLESHAVFTNLLPSGPFRGPGAAQSVWAAENHLDEVARRLGMDSLELRRRNIVQDGDRYFGGGELRDLHFDALLDEAERAIGWQEKPSVPSGPVRRGRAIALCIKTTRTPSTSAAMCKLNEDGSLNVLTSSVEMGQGARTALCQIAAEATGVPLEQVSISDPDTDVTPFDETTSASRTTNIMGTAIQIAGTDLKRQLADLAVVELEVAPDDLLLDSGVISVRGAPERSISYGALIRKLRIGTVLGQGRYQSRARPDPVTGQPGVSDHWHHGVCAAEVEVDTETGRVAVRRIHAGVFAGRVVNPQQCELQNEGSAIFGLGQGLMEEMVFDSGRLTNPNLSDYLIPSFKDVPERLTTHVLEGDSGEIHGLGETLLPPAVAAVTAAVADAIGHSITELPLAPERVLRAIREREG